MTSALRSMPQVSAPVPAARILNRIVGGLHWLRIAHAEQRRRARSRRELAQLDAHALHDLGIDRGEIDSFLAEAMGDVEATRRRIVDDVLARRQAL